MSAVESEPPDTASARLASPATGSNRRVISESEKTEPGGSAAGTLHFRLGSLSRFRGLRELRVDLRVGGASLLLLPEPVQGEAELQEAVRCLPALWKVAICDEERLGRALVITLHIISFAEPVLRIAGEAVVPVFLEKRAKTR